MRNRRSTMIMTLQTVTKWPYLAGRQHVIAVLVYSNLDESDALKCFAFDSAWQQNYISDV